MAAFGRPDPVGSGRALSVRPPLPRFPNNVELVQNEEHTKLLAALLPALNKYQCLDVGVKKTRRSPWVRTFVDLYHPAGAWGKFSNVPDITSKQKYRFKSYQLPKIFDSLEKYLRGATRESAVHLELYDALNEYYSRDQYFKDFLAACEPIAATQANKPMQERSAFPTDVITDKNDTGVARLVVETETTANDASSSDSSSQSSQPSDNDDEEEDQKRPAATSTPPSQVASLAGRWSTPRSQLGLQLATRGWRPAATSPPVETEAHENDAASSDSSSQSSQPSDDEEEDQKRPAATSTPPSKVASVVGRWSTPRSQLGLQLATRGKGPAYYNRVTPGSSKRGHDEESHGQDTPARNTRRRVKERMHPDGSETVSTTNNESDKMVDEPECVHATKGCGAAKKTDTATEDDDENGPEVDQEEQTLPASGKRSASSMAELPSLTDKNDGDKQEPPSADSAKLKEPRDPEGRDTVSTNNNNESDNMVEDPEVVHAKKRGAAKKTTTDDDENEAEVDREAQTPPASSGKRSASSSMAELLSLTNKNDGDKKEPPSAGGTKLEEEEEKETAEAPTQDASSLVRETTKQQIEKRREELSKMFQRRKNDGKGDNDPLCKKIQEKIDAEDEKLLELILME
ncbi:expressed unknown protein [Seminavis robusta]|uniref:Uncharacterized protein n=1 Tax=Seminavis robusta TaxID=568900 RepID=A0A9N8EZY2_9STRA|nr:expressed unknown protein [Seminavis robusta]|eukprot:Sro2078_g313660.1 n/a (630) ;mRNA; f:7545-9639